MFLFLHYLHLERKNERKGTAMAKNMNENTKPLTKKELRDIRKKKKRQIKNAVTVISVIIAIGVFIGILFASGAFDYRPQGTYDVLITIENYGSIHVELYGNDAPETVAHFRKLVDEKYYDGKSVFKLFDDLAYMGSASSSEAGIKGEFSENGFENKVSHKRGVLSMAKDGAASSAYGQFFIVREDSPELNGKYAAFGKVTDGMEIIDKIFKDIETDENGMIEKDSRPRITSISGHASHTH